MSESDDFPSETTVLPLPSSSLMPIWFPEMDRERELLKPFVAAAFMNCIAYGIYVPMFCWSLHALFFAMKNSPNRRVLLWISTILFVLCTAQASLFNLKILLLMLWRPLDLIFIGPLRILYYIPPFMYISVVYIADGVFTYRLFHVWGRQWWVIIFPMIAMLVAPVFCAITTVITHSANLYPMGLEFLVPLDSFVTNLYITSMISFKVWQNNRNMRHLGRSGLTSIIPLLLESAGIYTVFSAVIALCQTSPVPWLLFRFLDQGSLEVLTSVAGIAYSLMIILVARGRSGSGDIKSTAMTSLNFCVVYDLQDLETAAQSSQVDGAQ